MIQCMNIQVACIPESELHCRMGSKESMNPKGLHLYSAPSADKLNAVKKVSWSYE
jgi:hypothetical protein